MANRRLLLAPFWLSGGLAIMQLDPHPERQVAGNMLPKFNVPSFDCLIFRRTPRSLVYQLKCKPD